MDEKISVALKRLSEMPYDEFFKLISAHNAAGDMTTEEIEYFSI